MTAAIQLRVPFVIAHAGEIVEQPVAFVQKPFSGLRLAFQDPRRTDMNLGVLRARSLTSRQGAPQWRKLNTLRHWRCMTKHLCQVCGRPAKDPETGRIPWITTETAFDRVDPYGGFSSAPATCWDCIPESLATCPRLHVSSAVWTVASAEPAAVLADMYEPGQRGRAVPTGQRSVFVGLNQPNLLRRALATQLVVRLRDMQPARSPDRR